MTQDERNKLYIANCLIAKEMTISEAAEILGLSERQVKRIKKGVKEHGGACVIHKNRGQLVESGFKSPKKHTTKVKKHKRRKRKPQRGMLIIIDASPHAWSLNGEEYSLHGAVDDATGEILAFVLLS